VLGEAGSDLLEARALLLSQGKRFWYFSVMLTVRHARSYVQRVCFAED